MSVTINGRGIAPRVAPVWRRLAALAFDTIVCAILTGIPSLMSEVVLQAASEDVRDVMFAVVVYLVFVAYHGLVPVVNNGQTAGMYATKVKVVEVQSLAAPSPERCMVRSLALVSSIAVAIMLQRLGPFYITGPLIMAALLLPALARSDRRALHDLIAGTRVVSQPVR